MFIGLKLGRGVALENTDSKDFQLDDSSYCVKRCNSKGQERERERKILCFLLQVCHSARRIDLSEFFYQSNGFVLLCFISLVDYVT